MCLQGPVGSPETLWGCLPRRQSAAGSCPACWPWCQPVTAGRAAWSPQRCLRSLPGSTETKCSGEAARDFLTLDRFSGAIKTFQRCSKKRDQLKWPLMVLVFRRLHSNMDSQRSWCFQPAAPDAEWREAPHSPSALQHQKTCTEHNQRISSWNYYIY